MKLNKLFLYFLFPQGKLTRAKIVLLIGIKLDFFGPGPNFLHGVNENVLSKLIESTIKFTGHTTSFLVHF